MAQKSGIEWTDHTFNPWWGCMKVSPGCDHCYAERDAKRYQPGVVLWGEGSTRRTFGDAHWNEPRRWDRAAQRVGRRSKVFCASMADVFDKDAPAGARERLWALIRETPNLDWLILTKRIGNATRMLPADWDLGYPNVWLGASVVNQDETNRDVPKLLGTPAYLRFLSCEPLLGPIDLERGGWSLLRSLRPPPGNKTGWDRGVDWIIVGGESGPRARAMDIHWARAIRHQCEENGVAFFFKQGSQANWADFKNFDSFPAVLQVRDWPNEQRSGPGHSARE